jgi:hypothetical protein
MSSPPEIADEFDLTAPAAPPLPRSEPELRALVQALVEQALRAQHPAPPPAPNRRATDIFRHLSDVTARLSGLLTARDDAYDALVVEQRTLLAKQREVMQSPFFQTMDAQSQEWHLEDNLAAERMAVARAEALYQTHLRQADKALQQAANLRVLGMMCTVPGGVG